MGSSAVIRELPGSQLRSFLRICVVWDLDSTLARTSQRHWMLDRIRAGDADWDDYAMECVGDDPAEGPVQLMRLMPQYRHVIISGRSARAVDLTVSWLSSHQVPADELRLAPPGGCPPGGAFKVSEIRAIQAEGREVLLVVEDFAEAAALIRQETGIPVLGITQFYPVQVPAGHAL